MSEWRDETWAVVGGWLNEVVDTVPDPSGDGPWLPTLGAVREALDGVEAAWLRIQPEGAANAGSAQE
jgi:hypothetical protein